MRTDVFFLLAICMIIGLNACDKVENPHPPVLDFDLNLFPGEPEDYPYPVFEPSSNNLKNVLLDDYTGHKCVPCVAAAETAKGIEATNPGRAIAVSVHASPSGNFQQVDDEHPTDFTTEAGDIYSLEMNGPDFNPVGTINRTLDDFTGEPSIWQFEFQWIENVSEQIDTPLEADLQVNVNYYAETDGLFIHSRMDVLSPLNGTFNIVHYLIRREVISPQSTASGVDEEYEHHNVLSDNIGGAWGINMLSGSINTGASKEHQLSFKLPNPDSNPTYHSENLSIVSYIVNRDTYEVLQVVHTELN